MRDHSSVNGEIELTILMPCLNEARTLETCIRKPRDTSKSRRFQARCWWRQWLDRWIREIALRGGARLIESWIAAMEPPLSQDRARPAANS